MSLRGGAVRALGMSIAGALAAAGLALVYAAVVPTGQALPSGSKASPFSLTVFSWSGLPPEVQAQEAASAPLLFDRDTNTQHAAFAESQVQATFEVVQEVRAIKVFGAAPYVLTVKADAGGSFQNIAGLVDLNLTLLAPGWNTFPAAVPASTSKLLFALTPASGGSASGLRELEVWTAAHPVSSKDGAALLERLLGPTPPQHARLYTALNPTANPTVGVVTHNDSGGGLADNKFTFSVDRDPAHFVRAYLTYELFGQASFVSPLRKINGLSSNAGGGLLLPAATWSNQAERINPAWLKSGANTIEFSVLSSSNQEAGYTVRNVRVVTELDNGANAIEAISANQPDASNTNPVAAMYDGDLESGWRPYPADQPISANVPALEVDLRRPIQLEGVSVYMSSAFAGQVQLSIKQAGQWLDFPPEAPGALDTGWNTIQLPASVALEQRLLEGARLTFLGGLGSSTEVRELLVVGSAVGGRTAPPRIFTTFPDQGQFYGRRAFVQGFVEPWNNGSGLASIKVGGVTVFHNAGSMSEWVTKEQVGLGAQADSDAWSAEIKVVYPNGETVSSIVQFGQQLSAASPLTGPLAGTLNSAVGPKTKKTISHDESKLVVDSGTVSADTTITITPLAEESVPALDVGMVNVTKGPRRGYRFLPHGAKFLKNVNVTLPYDRALIPPGHTEDDVRTYFFDEQAGRWVALPFASVDKTNKLLNSTTNHFTDMINAVVTVPDHPQAVSFNPTSMKDIKAADPGAQVNLIEPPKVNNMGDARLSYPIEVPPGRQGQQPQLSISYNSSGGNGWLGVGWDLSVPSISIDTRFGVPKYDEAKREETYLLNGQQMVKVGEGEYRLRVEGSFQRIRRHGTAPNNYWWAVTDKNGLRQIFGGDAAAQLRDPADRGIFTWHLSRSIDSNGNTIDYEYLPKHQAAHNSGEQAVFTYLREIRYAGSIAANQSDEAVRTIPAIPAPSYYRVLFHHDATLPKRLDAVVDGRPAFKTVLDERLKAVEIDLIEAGAPRRVRSYVLNYRTGDFDKTLLTTIVQHGADAAEFNRHSFDYFDMPKIAGGYDGFSEREQWTMPAVGSALSRNRNRDRYVGGYLGLGVNTPNIHVGFNRGWGEGKSETEFSTTDLNGDGLPDFLQQGGTYYLNTWRHDGAGATAFTGRPLSGPADQIGKDENKLRASDVGLNLDAAWMPFRVTASRGSSTTDNTGRKMMADINGDGLVDQLSIEGGFRAALNNGGGFNGAIPWNGGVNLAPPLSDAERQEILNTYPLTDPVRAWVAPFKGVVSLSGSVSKPQASNAAAGDDGVQIAIFKGTNATALWNRTFQAVETMQLTDVPQLQSVSVEAGERLFVKLSSLTSIARDTLFSDISVAYKEVRYVDRAGIERVIANPQAPATAALPTGQAQFSFNSTADFALTRLARPDLDVDHRYAWSAPYKGQVVLSQLLAKQASAEDVVFQIVRFRAERLTGEVTRETLFTRYAQAGETFSSSLPDAPVTVLAGDRLAFDIILPKHGISDAARFSWRPELRYSEVCMPARAGIDIDDPATYTLGNGQSSDQFFDSEVCSTLTPEQQQRTDQDVPGAEPAPGVAPTKLFIFNPTPLLNIYPFARQEPVQAWVAPRDGVVRLVARAFKNAATPSDIHLKVQSTNQLIAQHSFAAAAINASAQIMSLDVPVTAGQRLFFNVHSRDAIPRTFTDASGAEQPVFDWTPELLYVDSPHCYVDPASGQQACVPIATNYTSASGWTMHFDSLCLAPDRCVPVDCTGARSPGAPVEQAPSQCVTPPNTQLTASERAAFNLNRIQYIVPVVNRDYLNWTPYASTPLQGHYRDWSYIAWNGNQPWDAAKLQEPSGDPNAGLDLNSEAGQVEAGNRAGNRPYFNLAPLAPGNARHPGLALWEGPGIDDYVAAGQAQPSRIGAAVDGFLTAGGGGAGGGIGDLRKTRTQQDKKSLGAGPVGASLNEGPSITQLDLIDLNGDRYPDQVSGGRIVFNRGDGSFEATPVNVDLAVAGDSSVRRTESKTAGLSLAIGHIFPEASASGVIRGIKSLGPSIGTNYGSSRSRVDFIDINGDGLPDRVFRDGAHVTVRLNLGGDRFGAPETWSAGNWEQEDTSRLPQYFSISPNTLRVTDTVGANVGGGAIISGSFSASGSRTVVDLTDINGDGLPDMVMKMPGSGAFRVRLNRGNDFGPEHSWRVPGWGFDVGRGATARLYGGNDVLGYQESSTETGGINLHHQWSIPIPFCCVLWIHVKADGNLSNGEGGASMMMLDIDGDGAPDHVFRQSNSTEVHVKRGKVGKANVLKSVRRPLGGSFEIDYVREGNFVDRSNPNNLVEMNTSKWTMSRVVVHDGQGNSYPTLYKHFTSGFYDRGEREGFGFSHCQETRADGATTDYLYHNQDYTRKGLLFRKVVRDRLGRVFTREENTYDVLTVKPAEGSRPPVRFPPLARSEKHFYEGQAIVSGGLSPLDSMPAGTKRSAQSFTYETTFGNVVAFTDEGDLDTPLDNATASIGYFQDLAAYIVKPSSITVTSGGQTLRQRVAAFEPGTGNLRQVQQSAGGGQVAVTDLTYFANGNLQSVVGPANHASRRYALSYEYDKIVNTHITRISDVFNLSSQAGYDFRFGKLTVTVDTNNNTTTTSYDSVARVSGVVGPYQHGTGNTTLRFEYHPEATVPYALTQHLDVDADGNTKASGTVDTILFADGLKRVLQTKKDATVLQGSAPLDRMIVSGRVVFDEVGRTIRQFYPVVEPLGQGANFNTSFDDGAPPTVTEYDALDRVTKTTLPDGSFTTVSYGFGLDRGNAMQFETVVTDANANAGQKGAVKRTYRDARELITAVKELNKAGSETIWTSYVYDALKQIVEVKDDKNNVTTVAYDTLGRRTVIDNPDTGRAETQYDAASNVTKKITANLKAQAKAIDYAYDFNRLASIKYPNFPGNDVTYTYGLAGAAFNSAGRITKITSQMGSEERQYGKLGETAYEKKVVITFTNPAHPQVYETRFAFDTFGRMLRITYPDGEIVTNVYDSGGNLQSASGVKAAAASGQNHRYNYLQKLHYDKFEQRIFVEQGNGVKTAYTYNAQTRRLSNLTAMRQGNNLFQNLQYSYDKVGNVLGLQNVVEIPPANVFGGPTNQTFAYDELYRLTHAQGTYQYMPNKTHTYSLDLTYDTIHNIVRKNQLHQIVQPSTTAITQKKTTYDFSYAYAPSGPTSVRPHAPINIGERTFKYDANGNQTGWDHDRNGTKRTIVWDEENRIQSLFDNGHEKTYKYDDQGNRLIKRGPQGETVYVNQFFTDRPGANGTKHVYAGTSRIASKLMRQDAPNANPAGKTPFEKDLYFYHPDHLGSSSYITDLNGKLYEHLEYFPFGEAWVEENSNHQRTPYLFTAKELDEETGLYAFGGRYYDPRTSVWQSADPMLDRYLTGRVNAGVFNSRNLALYTYTYNNPLVLTDPDGRAPIDPSKWTGREPLYSGAVGAPSCTTIRCNSDVYDRMDTSLATGRVGTATRSDWFAAASLVTGARGLGGLDFEPDFTSESSESYLKSVHHSLAKENYATFNALLAGTELPGLEGLRGKALDYALVDKEQGLVTKFTNQYFGANTAARNKAFSEINQFFDPKNILFRGNSEPVQNVIRDRFEQRGRKFDIGNEGHRRELGHGIIDYINQQRRRGD